MLTISDQSMGFVMQGCLCGLQRQHGCKAQAQKHSRFGVNIAGLTATKGRVCDNCSNAERPMPCLVMFANKRTCGTATGMRSTHHFWHAMGPMFTAYVSSCTHPAELASHCLLVQRC